MEGNSTPLLEAELGPRVKHILGLLQDHRSNPGRTQPLIVELGGINKHNLQWVSNDLLQCVLDFIKRKTDRYNLCLVSKRFNLLTVPRLYRTVEIDMERDFDCYASILTRGNVGIDLIKTIRVSYTGKVDKDMDNRFKWLQIFLRSLRKDSLTQFHWDLPTPIPYETLKLLWKTQRKLETLYLHETCTHDPHSITGFFKEFPNILDSFQEVKSITVIPKSPKTFALAAQMFRQSSRLKSVEFNFRNYTLGSTTANNDVLRLWDSINRTLLEAYIPQSTQNSPLCLTTLALSDVSLNLCGPTWLKFVNFRKLKHLKLTCCPRVDILFDTICSEDDVPQLETFRLIHELEHDPNGNPFGDMATALQTALDQFLMRCAGSLNDLRLYLANTTARHKPMPAAESLIIHGSTLKRLVLDSYCNTKCTQGSYEHDVFKRILDGCPSIIELGIALPDHGYYDRHGHTNHLSATKMISSTLPHLKVFNIHNLPYLSIVQSVNREHEEFVREALLCAVAASIFQQHDELNKEKPRSLRTITFGLEDGNGYRDFSPMHFVPATTTGGGQTRDTAMRVQHYHNLRYQPDIVPFELDYGDAPRRDEYRHAYGARPDEDD